MRVITFSTKFPSYHPRKGEPTFFVEKIYKSTGIINSAGIFSVNNEVYGSCEPKHHTIRAGNRWKVGDYFSPRVWSGKPYASKQIEFAPPIQIKKIWDIIIERDIESRGDFNIIMFGISYSGIKDIAINDGLSVADFMSWFNKSVFKGQIICWNDQVNYP